MRNLQIGGVDLGIIHDKKVVGALSDLFKRRQERETNAQASDKTEDKS